MKFLKYFNENTEYKIISDISEINDIEQEESYIRKKDILYLEKFLKKRNINTLAKLTRYYPKLNFLGIKLKMNNGKITHDPSDYENTITLGNENDKMIFICEMNLYIKS